MVVLLCIVLFYCSTAMYIRETNFRLTSAVCVLCCFSSVCWAGIKAAWLYSSAAFSPPNYNVGIELPQGVVSASKAPCVASPSWSSSWCDECDTFHRVTTAKCVKTHDACSSVKKTIRTAAALHFMGAIADLWHRFDLSEWIREGLEIKANVIIALDESF